MRLLSIFIGLILGLELDNWNRARKGLPERGPWQSWTAIALGFLTGWRWWAKRERWAPDWIYRHG